jgi:uncharacterized protein DUF6221
VTLVDFLRARAAETLTRTNEVVAQCPVPWRRQDDSFRSGVIVDSRGWAVLSGGGLPARYVEDWEPARVQGVALAVEALLREHRPLSADYPSQQSLLTQPDACAGCGLGPHGDLVTVRMEDCPSLRAVARIWADHPDYDRRWSTPASG